MRGSRASVSSTQLDAVDTRRRETCSWQTGWQDGIKVYSKQHIWNLHGTRMLCGAAPGWTIGNFGPSNSGRCTRCYAIAESDGLTVTGQSYSRQLNLT